MVRKFYIFLMIIFEKLFVSIKTASIYYNNMYKNFNFNRKIYLVINYNK